MSNRLNNRQLDARRHSRDELLARREKVIQLYQSGTPVMKIMQQTGLSWSAVNAALRLYKEGGVTSLKPAARGRKVGMGRILTPEQEAQIRMFVRFKRPRQYGLKASLWSADTLRRFIAAKFNVMLSERGLSNYLNRWGLRGHASSKRPVENCSHAIRIWMDENYPELLQRVKSEDAIIYWYDKSVPLSTALWNQKKLKKIPTADMETTSLSSSIRQIISATNNQGRMVWLIIPGAFSVVRQIRFVQSLIKDCDGRKLFLIKNRVSDFSAASFTKWLVTESQSTEIFPPTN